MILLYYYFACYITLSTVLQSCHANDPEVIQQFWKQLYSQLPDPSLPNRLSNGQQMGVKLSVAVESAEFGHAYDDYVTGRSHYRLITGVPRVQLSGWTTRDLLIISKWTH
uniref:Secreted protein n=1 Tax=Mesocestoides corti TaxID=53468 RepID=A0A5K3F7M9_MESCO